MVHIVTNISFQLYGILWFIIASYIYSWVNNPVYGNSPVTSRAWKFSYNILRDCVVEMKSQEMSHAVSYTSSCKCRNSRPLEFVGFVCFKWILQVLCITNLSGVLLEGTIVTPLPKQFLSLLLVWHQISLTVETRYSWKNAVFCDVTRCGSCKNRCFGGT
jgi:hypothetical protein